MKSKLSHRPAESGLRFHRRPVQPISCPISGAVASASALRIVTLPNAPAPALPNSPKCSDLLALANSQTHNLPNCGAKKIGKSCRVFWHTQLPIVVIKAASTISSGSIRGRLAVNTKTHRIRQKMPINAKKHSPPIIRAQRLRRVHISEFSGRAEWSAEFVPHRCAVGIHKAELNARTGNPEVRAVRATLRNSDLTRT